MVSKEDYAALINGTFEDTGSWSEQNRMKYEMWRRRGMPIALDTGEIDRLTMDAEGIFIAGLLNGWFACKYKNICQNGQLEHVYNGSCLFCKHCVPFDICYEPWHDEGE